MEGQLHVLVIPHTIIFYHNALWLILFFQFDEIRGVKGFLLLNGHHFRARLFQKSVPVLFLPLFADNQKGTALYLKVRLL